MMKHEFEELAGYEVSDKDYNTIIEPMYMAVEMNKQDFVKVIDKKRFALPTKNELVRDMKKSVDKMLDKLGVSSIWDEEHELEDIRTVYANRFGYEHFYFQRGYAYPELCGGCTFPYAVVFYNDRNSYESRVVLDKVYDKKYGIAC